MPVDRHELQRLIPALRRFSRGLLGEASAADDLVQDCLVLALDRETQFRGGSLRPWLFAILANLSRSRHRSDRRTPAAEAFVDAPDAGLDPALRMTLSAALGALPDEQCRALLLTAVEGFSYEEAAQLTGVPLGTVMSRIHRARQALGAALGEPNVVPIRRVK